MKHEQNKWTDDAEQKAIRKFCIEFLLAAAWMCMVTMLIIHAINKSI